MIPILAESIAPFEDGLTHTLKRKEGLKWSDGEAIIADDVVFYYNTLDTLSPQYYINASRLPLANPCCTDKIESYAQDIAALGRAPA